MNFFFNLKKNQKFFFIIIFFLLILTVVYIFLKEKDKEDLSQVKEVLKIEKDDSPNEPEREKTVDSQKVVKEKLEKKEVKTKSQKKTKFIEEKPVVEDVENIVSDTKEATQTILELHQGLKDISGKNSTVLKSTTKLINETYYSEEMLNMIIGDSWKNADNQTKKKMIDVFEEYIAKNYIKRFSKIKYPQFSNLEEKKVGKYKMIKSHLILSEDEKVSINYLLSLKNEKWKIFDVLLAGSVSEIATKKSEFKSFIKDGDINPLIEALSKKNKILLTK